MSHVAKHQVHQEENNRRSIIVGKDCLTRATPCELASNLSFRAYCLSWSQAANPALRTQARQTSAGDLLIGVHVPRARDSQKPFFESSRAYLNVLSRLRSRLYAHSSFKPRFGLKQRCITANGKCAECK